MRAFSGQKHINTRKQLTDSFLRISFVIRLGFEPKTPSLKGMCSTD